MKVGKVKSWIFDNMDPLVWQRITLRLLPDFREEGFFFHTINDDSVMSRVLTTKVDQTLFDLYKKHLPSELLAEPFTN